jgi:hypothetical protein
MNNQKMQMVQNILFGEFTELHELLYIFLTKLILF